MRMILWVVPHCCNTCLRTCSSVNNAHSTLTRITVSVNIPLKNIVHRRPMISVILEFSSYSLLHDVRMERSLSARIRQKKRIIWRLFLQNRLPNGSQWKGKTHGKRLNLCRRSLVHRRRKRASPMHISSWNIDEVIPANNRHVYIPYRRNIRSVANIPFDTCLARRKHSNEESLDRNSMPIDR